MAHIVDERGYNQIFATSAAQTLRLKRRAEAIIAALPPGNPASRPRVLEIGCGTGEMARQLARQTAGSVTGVDLSPQFIEEARARHPLDNLDFRVADLTSEIPGQGDAYDAIVGNGILHHLYRHLDEVLPALRRWLRPGGRLIFWEPNLWNPYVYLIFSYKSLRRRAKLEPDEMAFTRDFIQDRLHASGFRTVSVRTRDFLLPNTPDALVRPLAAVSNVLDHVPLINRTAQSLFIVAEKPE